MLSIATAVQTVYIGRFPSAPLRPVLSRQELTGSLTHYYTAYGHMGELDGLGISCQSTRHLKHTNWTHKYHTNDSTAIVKHQCCPYLIASVFVGLIEA